MTTPRARKLVLLLSFGLLIPGASLGSAAQSPEETTFFYSDDVRIPLHVALDRVGVVTADGVRTSAAEEVASRLGLRLTSQYPQGVLVFSLPERQERSQIVKLARTLRRLGEGILSYTGFVAQPEDAAAPFLVTDEFIVKFRGDVSAEEVRAQASESGVDLVSLDPLVANQFLLRVTDRTPLDALEMANRYHQQSGIAFSHPNFVRVVTLRR